jgi:2-polyprenyl-6-methoxyphenol hydroxylase-like FAD-dependent oxidoreductase
MQSSNSYHDALVFGTGPAACIFAINMVRRGKTVLLVPSRDELTQRPWAETLAPRGEFLLVKLGLADHLLAHQHSTQMMLSCWRSSHPETTNFALDPHGRMWHVDRQVFDKALLIYAVHSGAGILDSASYRLSDLRRRAGQWEIRIASLGRERVIKIGHLVDATGKVSFLARFMGARRVLRDHLVAISCIYEQASDIAPLLIEPASKGWWYSLGLPQRRTHAGFVTDPKLVKLSSDVRRFTWNAMLDQAPHTAKRLTSFGGSLAVVSAESACLDRMGGEGWLAIGDASMSFDPLSSHGLCSAIEQAVDAAEILSAAERRSALSDFEMRRRDFFAKYKSQRTAFYRSVRRFSQDLFWQHRTLN